MLARATREREMPVRSEPRTRATRSVVGPICAIGWLALCLALAPTSCLNPFPDDQPSSRDDGKTPTSQMVAAGPEVADTSGSAPPSSTGAAMAPGAANGFEGLNESPGLAEEADAGVPIDAGPDAQPVLVR